MNIFQKIKQFFQEKQEPVETIKIKEDEIKDFILKKQSDLEEQENSLSKEIKNNITELTESLTNDIEILKSIDLSEKKEHERAKNIVTENLKYYTLDLESLTKELESLKDKATKPNELIDSINSITANFKKKSNIHFQKATYLVGKELESVQKNITNFFNNLNKILKDNQNLIKESKTIILVKNNLEKIKEIENTLAKLNENIVSLNNEIKDLESKNTETEKDIQDIRDSQEYKEETLKQRNYEEQEKKINNKIIELKKLIDFKELAKLSHSIEKEMILIKKFRDDFKESFDKNKEELVDLINSLENSEEISNKISEISKEQKELAEVQLDTNKQNEIKDLESQISKNKQEIESINIQKLKQEKIKERQGSEKQEITDRIKESLGGIGVEVD